MLPNDVDRGPGTPLDHTDPAIMVFLAEASPASTVYIDADERYRFVNHAYRHPQLRHEQILGQTLREVLGESFYAVVRPHAQRALAGERVVFDVPASQPDGSVRIFENTLVPHVVDGRVRGFLSHSIDVTERQRKVDAIAKDVEFLRAIADGVPGPIAYADREVRYRYVNRWYAEWEDPDRMLGRTAEEILGPETYAGMRPYVERALAGEKVTYSYQLSFPHVKEPRELEITYEPHVVDGQVQGLVAFGADLTEINQKTRALAAGEARFRAIFEGSPLGNALLDRGGVIVRANTALAEMLGYPPAELQGKTFLDITHPDDRAASLQKAQSLVAGLPDTFDVDKRYVRRDGSILWAHTIVSRIDDAGGSPIIVAVVEDTSEKRRLETQLLQAQKLQAIGALAGGVAHDFNNILTSLNAHVETLRAPETRARATAEALDDIERLHRRAAGLTQKLLAFARRQVIHLEPLDLNLLVEHFAAIAVRVLGEHIAVETELDPALPIIEGDATQLDQVLLNLVLNARDAMPGGGRLLLATRALPGLTAAEPARAEVAVHDCGTGIPAALLPRIFEPFVTTKPVGQGAGLGLPVVHGIVEQHRGVLAVESREGSGTTMRIVFPGTARRLVEATTSATRKDAPRFSTVLLAEDDPDLRYLVQRMLEKAGYNVWPAANGEEATQLFAARPDEVTLAVFDVVMPRMGGLEACRILRERRPDLPVLFVSGYSQDLVDRGAGLDTHTAFHPKPFTSEQLLATVSALLGRVALAKG